MFGRSGKDGASEAMAVDDGFEIGLLVFDAVMLLVVLTAVEGCVPTRASIKKAFDHCSRLYLPAAPALSQGFGGETELIVFVSS